NFRAVAERGCWIATKGSRGPLVRDGSSVAGAWSNDAARMPIDALFAMLPGKEYKGMPGGERDFPAIFVGISLGGTTSSSATDPSMRNRSPLTTTARFSTVRGALAQWPYAPRRRFAAPARALADVVRGLVRPVCQTVEQTIPRGLT